MQRLYRPFADSLPNGLSLGFKLSLKPRSQSPIGYVSESARGWKGGSTILVIQSTELNCFRTRRLGVKMSLEYDVMSAVREAVRRGGRVDYSSYGRPSRRGRSLGLHLPRLTEQGAHLALVVHLSPDAAGEFVDEARNGLEQVLGEHPLQSIAVIGPEKWAEWALDAWRTRRYSSQDIHHIEAEPGGELAAVEELETEPSAVVVLTDQDLVWPEEFDGGNTVLIALPRSIDEGVADRVVDPSISIADVVRVEQL